MEEEHEVCDICDDKGWVEETCYCDGGDRTGHGRCPTCKGAGVVYGFCDCKIGQEMQAARDDVRIDRLDDFVKAFNK